MQRVLIIKELEEIKARIESIIETLEVMNDEELAQSIKKVLEEADRGELKDFDEILEDLEISEFEKAFKYLTKKNSEFALR
ncbi:MAG: hypothetical protein QXM45_02980 [Archaeoglobaceae archaeon]